MSHGHRIHTYHTKLGAGLRVDMERLEGSAVALLLDKLRESGVPEETLAKAASEVSKLDA